MSTAPELPGRSYTDWRNVGMALMESGFSVM